MSEDKITEIESKYKENIEDKVSGFIISVTDYQFLMSVIAALREQLKPVEEVYKVLELSSEWQLIQAIKAACERK